MFRPTARLAAAALTLLAVTLGTSAAATPTLPAPGQFPHADFTAVLAKFVDAQGMVDYAGLKNDRAALDAYTTLVAATSPKKDKALFPTRNDQLAYWINAYNAWAMTGVINQPGIKSVQDNLFGFFYGTKYKLGGKNTSLYTLENKIVRKEFADPRVHMALNCQSMGCPRLPQKAFEAATLDTELDAAAAEFCANPKKVEPHPDEKKIKMSQIFEWYNADFAASGGPIGFCNKHGQTFDAGWTIEYIPYDWALMKQDGKGP
jgi:hypothetical protein